MAESTTDRIKVSRWSQDTDAFTRSQMDASHANIESYAAKFTSGSSDPTLPDVDYDRAFFYNTTSSLLKFCPSGTATSWVVVGSGTDFVRTTETQTLTNKTLTAPVIASIVNTGTLTLPTSTDTLVGRATTDTLTNKTLTEPTLTYPTMVAPEEIWSINASAPAAAQNIDVATASAYYFTSNTANAFQFNFRASSSVSLGSILPTGSSITIAVVVESGSSAYTANSAVKIDGTTTNVQTYWQGGNPPTGSANAHDIYTFSIVRTAATPVYEVFASQTKFA